MAATGGVLAKIAGALSKMTGGGGPDKGPTLELRITDFHQKVWPELKNSYQVFHQAVWETFLFYVGQFWIQWDDQRKIFQAQVPEDDYTPQPRINRFSPAIDAMASNFTKLPEIEAMPRPLDDLDSIGVAEVTNKLVEYFIKDNALESDYKCKEDKAGIAAQIFTLSGSIFTRVFPEMQEIGRRPRMTKQDSFAAQCTNCDTYQSGMTEPPPASCPTCQSQDPNVYKVAPTQTAVPAIDEATGQPATDPVTKSRVRVEIGNPLFAVPRSGATGLYDSPFFYWAQRRTLDEIRERFGIDDAEADTDQLDGFATSWEDQLNYWFLGYANSGMKAKDSALVVELHAEPGKLKDFPEGFYAVIIGGKVRKAIAWPFVENPNSMAGYLQIPTMFFARTPAFDLVQLQRELGAYEAIIKLHAMTSAVDPIIVDQNTIVSEITGRSDKIVKWRSIGPGSKEPHRMAHGSLDEGVYAQRDKLEQAFQNVTGAVNVWRGEQPGSITAASAISQLRGQAELMFSKPTQNWNNLWKETVRKGIRTMQALMQPWEIAAIVGKDKMPQIMMFKKADLDTCLEFIATSHGLPRSRDERRQEMIALYDRGALDMTDVNVREKLFELFGETGMLQQFNLDATRARLENRNLKEGGQATFMPEIEDLATHYSIHAQAIKALDFDLWPPNAKTAMLGHTMETKQALMAAMAMNQNSPAPKPPGPLGHPQHPGAPAGGKPPAPMPTDKNPTAPGGQL